MLAESPSIYYPGNIQGRNRKESGEKGASIINLSEASTTIDFIGTSPIIWEEIIIPLPKNSEINAFYREITNVLESYQGRSHSYFLHIIIQMASSQKINTNDWLQMLQEEVELSNTTFVWVHKLTTEITNRSNLQTWYESHLAGEEIMRSFEQLQDESAFYQSVEALYLESGANRYLDDLSEQERERLLENALMELGMTLAEVEGDEK